MKLKPGKLYILLRNTDFLSVDWRTKEYFSPKKIQKNKILLFVKFKHEKQPQYLDNDPVFLYEKELFVPLYSYLKERAQEFLEEIIL